MLTADCNKTNYCNVHVFIVSSLSTLTETSISPLQFFPRSLILDIMDILAQSGLQNVAVLHSVGCKGVGCRLSSKVSSTGDKRNIL